VPIRKKAYVEHLETSTSVGLVQMHNKPIGTVPDWIMGSRPDPKLLTEYVHTFTPGWARSANITLNLQKWPPIPLLSVRVPLGVLPTKPIKSKNGDAWLTLDKAEWSLSRNSTPAQPCLDLRVRFANTRRNGFSRGDYRARDDSGYDLDLSEVSSSSAENDALCDFEILGIKKGTKWIEFAIFSPEQLDANLVTLTFERMAAD